ncbi:uncharacterized protein LOC128193901 [Vigna angularis]|uniref:uncharacterized protein LOC128193901 n=1 Tax=Phaseolus angularis TaxID=3914 RepID=UPI0022B32F6E|nr:uncharacterized protein LOC128193901 [Vigna angularis]
MDGLVEINIQCDFRESDNYGNMEVDGSALPESDLEEDDIRDTSLFNDEWESEELTSPDISDEESDVEEGYGNFITFTMPKNMVDFNWEVGTYFGHKKDILDAIKTYALENGKNLKFIKNDKKRIRLKCVGEKGECPWMAYFCYMEAVDTWQLRTMVDKHTCSREHKLGVFNAKWLSKKLEKTRAKAYASDEVEGSFTMQYSRIYDYAYELLARNPWSTIKVKVEENDGYPIFLRFYACFKGCKDNFDSCRPIIGLDGAFLKGRHRGELLTAVARDANDQMMPLAYAIVEVENNETWTWFMELLIEDLGGPDLCSSLTLISDQQKGLLPAVQDLLSGVAHRFCVSWSVQKLFEVRHVSQSGDKFVVNIDEYSCSCKKWSISEIPCVHALAAMRFLNLDGEDYIPVCFLTSTYEEMYSSIIYPINGNNLWEVTEYPNVMPPSKRKFPSRPKKKRRLEQWELKKKSTRMSKGGLVKRCSKCRKVGHNRTRCPKTNQELVVQA